MIALALLLLELLALACLLSHRPGVQRLAIPLASLGTLLTWLLPQDYVGSRALLAVAPLWVLAHTIDFVHRPMHMSLSRRAWCLASTFDARLSRSVQPRIDRKLFASGLLCLAPSWLGFAVAFSSHTCLSRWAGGLLGFYSCVEALTRLTEGIHLAGGTEIPKTQMHPILSRSIGEFWGRRWNRPVARWLRRYCFQPWARTGRPWLGVTMAFVVSAFVHFYFVYASVGLALGLFMGAFFLVQIALVFIESAMQIRRWSPWMAHAWTLAVLCLASPFFIEPILQIIEHSLPVS